jgi:hypothetical protein
MSNQMTSVEISASTAGAYAIRNRVNGRVYVSGDLNVADALAYDRVALQRRQHRNDGLQADWDWYGEENFTFEVVATVERQLQHNGRGKLAQLLDQLRDELGAYGRSGYNARVSVPF